MTCSDRPALRALVERYAVVVDTRRFEDLAEVFMLDAILDTDRGRRQGLSEIRQAMARLDRYDRTDHRVGDATATIEGDTATGTAECVARHWFIEAGRCRVYQMAITYHDRYVRTSSGWRIAHRQLAVRCAETVDAD